MTGKINKPKNIFNLVSTTTGHSLEESVKTPNSVKEKRRNTVVRNKV